MPTSPVSSTGEHFADVNDPQVERVKRQRSLLRFSPVADRALVSGDQAAWDWIADQAGAHLENGDRRAIDAVCHSGQDGTRDEARMQRGEGD